MKSAAPLAAANKVEASAAIKGAAMVDNRAVAVAQRQAQAAIDSSPRQVAQRQQAAAAAPPRNTTGLPDNLKAGVENLSGYSLDDVTVHYNSAKPAQLQAHAYAQGADIHVAPGQEQHLPHEAWHVVQQKQGRVKATRQMKGGVNVNDNAGLENEADMMGTKAQQIEFNEPICQEKEKNKILNKYSASIQMAAGDIHNFPVPNNPNPVKLVEQEPMNRILFHGTASIDAANAIGEGGGGIQIPNNALPGRLHELGYGFYTTSIEGDARGWANMGEAEQVYVIDIVVANGVLVTSTNANDTKEVQLSTLPEGIDGVTIGGEQAWGKIDHIVGGKVQVINVEQAEDDGVDD